MSKIITAFDNPTGITAIVRESGKKKAIHIDVDWYFYIKLADFQKAKVLLLDFQYLIPRMIEGQRFVKIFVTMKYQHDVVITRLRDILESNGIEVFEYDLNKSKRYMVDSGIDIDIDLKILYFDIETDDSKNGISIGRDRILSWAGCDITGKEFFETGAEIDILKKLLRLLDKYDLVATWNGDEFDIPYVKARCELYRLNYD